MLFSTKKYRPTVLSLFHQPPLIAPTYKRSVAPIAPRTSESVIRNKAQNVDKYTFANYDAEHTHIQQPTAKHVNVNGVGEDG